MHMFAGIPSFLAKRMSIVNKPLVTILLFATVQTYYSVQTEGDARVHRERHHCMRSLCWLELE